MDGDPKGDGGARPSDDADRTSKGEPPKGRDDDATVDGGGDGESKDSPPKPPMSRGKKVLLWIVALVILLALVAAGVLYWLDARQFESTDDAFIDGHIDQVSSQVSGRVVRLLITDNQPVHAGDVLLEIDPRDFAVRLKQARAQLLNAQAAVRQAQAQVTLQQAMADQSAANVRVTEANLTQARQDARRYRSVNPQAVSRQQVDQSSATEKSAEAQLEANRQAARAGRAQVEASKAQVDAAQAQVQDMETQVANAELQLSYTKVVAPEDGHVARRTVEVGTVVSPGQSLLAVVAPNVWVTANFKETQLARMQIGQAVDLRVDAIPDVTYHAKIDSFQSGSGTVFSSLPAENATGNYVKVTQRLPVKIVFDDPRANGDARLAPGLSVSPRVKVR